MEGIVLTCEPEARQTWHYHCRFWRLLGQTALGNHHFGFALCYDFQFFVGCSACATQYSGMILHEQQ